MKKLTLVLLLVAAMTRGFTQQSNLKIVTQKSIKTDKDIKSLKVYNAIRIILAAEESDVIKVVGEKEDVENITVLQNGDEALITGSIREQENVTVYVPARYIERIYIHGGSIVTTETILSSKQIDVNINGSGTANIVSTGLISQNTIADYPLDSVDLSK